MFLNFNIISFISGLVPLHNACSYGHYEVTELLIKVSLILIFILVIYFIVYAQNKDFGKYITYVLFSILYVTFFTILMRNCVHLHSNELEVKRLREIMMDFQ